MSEKKGIEKGAQGMLRRVVMFVLMVTIVLTGVMQDGGEVHAREAGGGSIKGTSKVEYVDAKKYIPSKYVITPEFKKGKSELDIVSLGGARTKSVNGEDLIVQPPNSARGKLIFTYKKIANYKGRDVDLQFEVMGWGPGYFAKGSNYFLFYKNSIEFAMEGYNYVEVRATYRFTGPKGTIGELVPASGLGTYMNVIDLDINQYMSFTGMQYNRINKMYVYKNETWVDRWTETVNGDQRMAIGAKFYRNLTLDSPLDIKRGSVLFLVDGNEFRFLWSRDWTRPNHHGGYPIKGQNRGAKLSNPQRFLYTPDKPMATKPEKPTKRIRVGNRDRTTSTLTDLGGTINYRIYHTVPREASAFYYKSYVLKDALHPALTVKASDIQVYNNKGSRVTGQFDVAVKATGSGAKRHDVVTVKAKNSKRAEFHDKYYRFDIPAKLKSPAHVIGTLGLTGNVSIKNKGSININSVTREDYDTNEVTTNIRGIPEEYTKELEVEKVWKGDHKSDRPTEIDVELLKDGKVYQTATLTQDSGWKHTFTGLPLFKGNGWTFSKYTVREVGEKHYKSKVEQVSTSISLDKYRITNTWDGPEPTPPKIVKAVSVEKYARPSEPFYFDVDVTLPDDLIGYHSLQIEDVMDNRFDILGVEYSVLGGAQEEVLNLTHSTAGRKLYREFSRDWLEPRKGKTLRMRIHAKIKENLKIEKIKNEAVTFPNDTPNIVSNAVYVQPHPVEVGFKDIQIDTARKVSGLPVDINFNVREYNTSHLNDTFDVKPEGWTQEDVDWLLE